MADSKKKQQQPVKNPIESLRDIGSNTTQTLKKDLLSQLPKDFGRQLFGFQNRRYSGEIMPGEAIEMRDVYTGRREKEQKLQKQIYVERALRAEEQALVERRTNELRLQIQALKEEIVKLAQVTPDLSEEIEVAAIQVSGDPSTYELFFLEALFEYIKNFRIKAEDASSWLHVVNRRAAKKGGNQWGKNYKKHGAKYLLSGEHYATRSAA